MVRSCIFIKLNLRSTVISASRCVLAVTDWVVRRQHQEKPAEISQQFLSAVEEQYACMYLNSIGATNDEANMYVLCRSGGSRRRVTC